MLTKREVLRELQRVGITKTSQLRECLKDFEKYMLNNHGVCVSRTKKGLAGNSRTILILREAEE